MCVCVCIHSIFMYVHFYIKYYSKSEKLNLAETKHFPDNIGNNHM